MSSPSQRRDPYAEEVDAYMSNPAIFAVKDLKRWTFSDDNKVPIDFVGYLISKNVHGATQPDEQHLVDRDTLVTAEPLLTNHAFYADISKLDPFIVLDIEPSCPAHIAQGLINDLPWLYIERSMSGNGYHLLLPTPWPTTFSDGFLKEAYGDTPEQKSRNEQLWFDLTNRRVVRHNKGWYEILLNHYVTFTFLNDGLPPIPQMTQRRAKNLDVFFTHLMENSPKPQPRNVYTDESGHTHEFNIESTRPEHEAYEDMVKATLSRYRQRPYTRTLDDFEGDHSKWEYGVINHVHYIARNAVRDALWVDFPQERLDPIDENIYAWVIYDVVRLIIPPRDKHNTFRKSLPFLLYRVTDALPNHINKVDARVFDASV